MFDIRNFSDFCNTLKNAGFSMGGGNAKGIYAVIPFGWEDPVMKDSVIKWHTGDPETDPWEWRMRVLEERGDIAYAKVFFRSSGYISKEWYPFFYSVRRTESFEEAYENGKVSYMAKQIYDIISDGGEVAFHNIKKAGGFGKEANSRFERAIIELQMRMYITISGREQKVNKYGEGYGFSSTILTTVEKFWEKRGLILTAADPIESYDKIKEQILRLNPEAAAKNIDKFIKG